MIVPKFCGRMLFGFGIAWLPISTMVVQNLSLMAICILMISAGAFFGWSNEDLEAKR